MLEKPGYRDQLDSLRERFPGRETIGLEEACEVVGVSRWTLVQDRTFPMRRPGRGRNSKIVVPVVALARWLTA